MSPENLRNLRRRPLCIICGKPEEARTIAKALEAYTEKISGAEVDGVNKGHTFYLGQMDIPNNKPLDYYITSSLRQGMMHFATHAAIIFQALRPRFAIHAGVCAGNEAKSVKYFITVGQVIFGDAATCYEEGKWAYEGGEMKFQPDFATMRSSSTDLAGYTVGKKNYKRGDYVTGLAVREDAAKIFEKFTATVNRNVLALDMEASAFLHLCEHTGVESLGVIKGVSDLGNALKATDSSAAVYKSVLNTTGEAIQSFLEAVMENRQWNYNEDKEQGATLSKSYYNNFVRVVCDSISHGLPLEVESTIHNLKQPPKFKIVLPDELNPDNYSEIGHISSAVKKFRLKEAAIGNGSHRRTMYYRDLYIFDFPRTINTLCYADEPSTQTFLFSTFLKKKAYCKVRGEGEEAPLAEVISWAEFKALMPRSPDPTTVEAHVEALQI